MKILFITHYTKFYGANRSLRSLLNDFSRRGLEVHLLAPSYGEITEYCKQNGISYHIRKFKPGFVNSKTTRFSRVKFFIWNLQYYPRLVKLIFALKPDLIYTNSSVIDIGSCLSKLFKIKHIWHIREFGIKDYDVDYCLGEKSFLRKVENTDKVICISKVIQSEVVKKSTNSVVVYNGVINGENLESRQPLKYPVELFVFAMVGLIFPKKGHLVALRAFKKIIEAHPYCRFEIYGTGESCYTEKLVHYIQANDLSNQVSFKGYIDNMDMIYSQVNCLLMCSDYEGFGRVTVEAMSYGIPVIGKNSGGTPEIITDDYNGYLYDTEEQLSILMEKVVFDKKNYGKLSRNALVTASQFKVEDYTTKVYNLIQGI